MLHMTTGGKPNPTAIDRMPKIATWWKFSMKELLRMLQFHQPDQRYWFL